MNNRQFVFALLIGLVPFALLAENSPDAGFSSSSKVTRSPADVTPRSAESAFGDLKFLFVEKPDKSQWEEKLRLVGLTPWQGHEGMWRLVAPDGEVRIQAFFNTNETSVFLLFFPASKTPLSEATLSWMYRTAADYSFDGGEGVELQFPEETITGGQRHQSFFLSLTSSTLVRTVLVMRWK